MDDTNNEHAFRIKYIHHPATRLYVSVCVIVWIEIETLCSFHTILDSTEWFKSALSLEDTGDWGKIYLIFGQSDGYQVECAHYSWYVIACCMIAVCAVHP